MPHNEPSILVRPHIIIFLQIDIQLSGINKIVFHSSFITRHSTVNDVENTRGKKLKLDETQLNALAKIA